MYKQVFRYSPSTNGKVELVDRFHDLGGTHYSHVAYLSREEVILKFQEGVRFLYADEEKEYDYDLRKND